MSSVDNRIVKMVFDNLQFKKGAAETQKSLSDVDRAISEAGRGKGLLNLSSAMNNVSLTASKMSVVATAALATIASKATTVGLDLVKSLTIDPVKQGFSEYESLLSKQNVIMNATGKSAGEVKRVLNDLNHYSDKTIFSFGDMTEALTSFVNAGVPLPKASKAMQGIANASAFAGASTLEAQSSFRAFSQALGQGFLGLQDFRQAAVTGKIGTVQFKQALIDAAVAQGTLTKRGNEYVTKSGKTLTATKGFDLSLQEQWANTNVLNDALGQYGDQTTKIGKKAFKAAQDVRTFSAFMSTFKESLGSGFSQLFTTLIGGLDESTRKWTALSNTVGAGTQAFFNFANTAIKTFQKLGGAEKVLQGFSNIAAPFKALFTQIGEAWQKAFPTTAKGAGGVLYQIASGFEAITRPLDLVGRGIEQIGPIFDYLFAGLKIGAEALDAVTQRFEAFVSATGKKVSGAGIEGFFDGLLHFGGKALKAGLDFAGDLVRGVIQGFSAGGLDTAANVFSAGLIAGIFLIVRKSLKNGLSIDLGQGVLKSVSEGFGALTKSLTAMQQSLQAKTLMTIATAIGIMAASMIALSLVPGQRLAKSLAAMGAGMGQLLIGMALLSKIGGLGAFITLPILATGLVALATAMLIMTAAIAAMSLLSWEQIAKGLSGIAGALVLIASGMKLMPKTLPITAAGLLLVSISLTAIAGAMAALSLLSWESIGKGLVGVAGALVIIAGAMQLMPLTLPITAAGLVLVGIALTEIAGALALMAIMSWEEIGKGLATLGGTLALLAIGLNAMSGALPGSAALLIAAAAIVVLAPALMLLGDMSWKEIGKAMVALGGSLAILALGLTAMIIALPGAAALLVVSPALVLLAGALLLMSALSWGDIAKGLTALAAGLAVIGIAGALLAPVVPALIGLGAAMLLFGAGLALAGIGMLSFITGLGALVALGGVAFTYLHQLIDEFIASLPDLGGGFGKFLVELAKALQQNTPIIIGAFLDMLGKLIDGGRKLLPKIGKFFKDLGKTGIDVLRSLIPQWALAGADIIIAILKGLKPKIPKMADAAGDVAVAFIQGLAAQQAKLADAAAKAIIEFVKAISKAIDNNSDELGKAMADLGVAMGKGLIKGIGSMAGEAAKAAKDMAKGAVDGAKKLLHINSPSRVFIAIGKGVVEGMTLGIQRNAVAAINATASMVGGQIAVANEYISKFIQQLDQKALVAQGKADGLAKAADRASRAADKTKTKKDDKSADRLSDRAKDADRAAQRAATAAEKAKAKQDRDDAFAKADLFGKAQMRSEDAQTQLDASKASEQRAAKELAEAAALDREARNKNYSSRERKRMEREADELRKKARADAKAADKHIDSAKAAAADALKYQKLAGDEAAAAFQKSFEAEAKADADEKAFNLLSAEEKAALRRQQAADLQKQADADLASAQKLAYTDLDKANELAAKALDEADQARKYLDDATSLTGTSAASGGVNGTVVNLDPTDAAAVAMAQFSDLYDSAYAAAAGDRTVEFNQYNTSPVALTPLEIYRQTNNLFTYAADKTDVAV